MSDAMVGRIFPAARFFALISTIAAWNDARYAVDLTALDPLDEIALVQDAKNCPAFPLTRTPNTNGAYVQATVELFVTVNGVELRPESGGLFRVTYQQQADRYPACPK